MSRSSPPSSARRSGQTPTQRRAGPGRPAASAHSDAATRSKVIEAAVACILERGFYRASSNEIARRAGVTWGVIQHYFGTREALMLAVLQESARRFTEMVETATIEGESVQKRLDHLLDLLAEHYGQPAYLAIMQIQLNMDHDPRTSVEVRATMRAVAERSNDHIRRLLREALGRSASTPDLATTVFLAVRGFVVSQQLLETLTYDLVAPQSDRVGRQRRLFAEVMAPYLEMAARR
jgi:AcrR family transcriptional regulator